MLAPQIHQLELDAEVWYGDRHGPSALCGKRGSVRLVAGHELAQSASQGVHVDRTVQTGTDRHVVRSCGTPELLQKPQPLLREAQAGTVARHASTLGQGRILWMPALARHGVRQCFYGWSLQKLEEAHLHGHALLERGEHSHRGERVAAELEEIGIGWDRVQTEHFAPDDRDPGRNRTTGRDERGTPHLLKFAHQIDASDSSISSRVRGLATAKANR